MALPRWPNRFITLSLISLVQAYTVFETSCSAPATLSNYVSSPNTRGTLDILWSSLFTIFACTWSVQHPNVPAQRVVDDNNPTKRGWRAWIGHTWRSVRWGLKGCFRSTLRMFWTVIAPELIIATACGQLMEAREIEQKMKKYDLGDGVPWTLTHSYYANMGGFVVKNPSADKTIYHDPYHLTGEEIFELREGGYIDHFPSITEEEIKDKSKGDILGKLIALGQIAWSLCQIIARLVRRLPVSPLEVAVVAFAVCAVFMYALYWGKPQRVGVTQIIQLIDNDPLYKKANSRNNSGFFKDRIGIALEILGISTKFLHGAPISQDRTFKLAERKIVLAVLSLSAALFGGIHAIAWNFTFPSAVELELWRCASICTAAAPACTILIGLLINSIPESNSVFPWIVVFSAIISLSLTVLYPIARLFIIIEMFRTLYFLPPGSFISTWASNVPHVA